VVSHPPDGPGPRGVVRLLNTAAGRVLCLAGEVDGVVVRSFLERYGREPVRIDGIDAGSVTALSATALDLVRAHLDAAERAGRQVALRRPATVTRPGDMGGASRVTPEIAQAAAHAAD